MPKSAKLPNVRSIRHTKTDIVFNALRQMIIDLVFAPGALLQKEELTERFGVSRAPINEALARLQAEDLVDIVPQHGTFVQHIRIAKLQEGIFFRRAIEPKAMATVAKTIDEDVLILLDENLKGQHLAVAADDLSSLHRLDDVFHELIMGGDAFHHSRALIRTFSAHIERGRNLATVTKRKPDETLEDHEKIVRALKARDANWAESAMDLHLATSFSSLVQEMAENPEKFRSDTSAMLASRGKAG